MRLSTIILALALLTIVARSTTAQNTCPAPTSSNEVVFITNFGEISLELYPDKAPITVENFLSYVDVGFFNRTVFHRIIPGFVIQGGGYDEAGQEKQTRESITNEADNGLLNERGTLSMARTSDVNSATSQFFINLEHNKFLDHGTRDFGYAVFAKVTDGMDVVDEIAKVSTNERDEPTKPVVIELACRK
jgi:peptidyl-prolyl cis-trans isomerase A (cyclophilin A)